MFGRCVLWSIISLILCSRSSAQQYDLRTYSLEHGMPGATVNALCEDQDGYLWVGTNDGASRTNGIHFLIFGQSQGLPDNDVTALICDRQGAVWIGCRNGGIAVIRDQALEVISPGDAARGAIVDIVVGPDDIVHLATALGGIWRYTGGILQKDPSTGLPPMTIHAMVSDADEQLICGGDKGLHVLRQGRWQAVPGAGTHVTALHADEKGLLIGTTTGYKELDRHLATLPPLERTAGLFPITLPDLRITSILRARNGDLWIGTPSGLGHLSRRSGQPFLRVIGEANGLGHDLVRTLYQDGSGSIWVGTAFGGMSRFVSDAFTHFTDRDGLRSRTVSALHRTPDGILWIATLGGGVAAWDGHELVNYGRQEGLQDLYVTSLGETAEGYLLAGTGTEGVFRWNGRQFVRESALAHGGQRVYTIKKDRDDRIWTGLSQGVRIIAPDGTVTEHVIPSSVFDIAYSNDTAWLATGSGLYFLANGSESPHRYNTVPAVGILSIELDLQNNLWIGTDEHGLLRSAGSRIDSITVEHNSMGSEQTLTSNSVVSVLLDAYQNVWAGTRKGIHELELDVTQELVLGVRHFGPEDGFIGIEAFRNAAMVDADSTLWFGTLHGATRYDPGAVRMIEEEPKLHFTGLELFFEDIERSRWNSKEQVEGLPADLSLPFNQNHLTFNFTGISLAYPERVRYRYILEGHDPEWSPITNIDRVTYSNIPPGDYTFKVLARNASGIWTEEPLQYDLTIVAPIWQRTWTQILAALFVLLLVLGFIRYRERRARRIQQRLEGMVKVRTKELVQEQQRSDDLLLNILPRSTAEELKNKGSADTRHYESTTVLFSDFTGFTNMSSEMDGQTLVADLDHFFRIFDRITDKYGIEKIKTIGDAYMCASGIPEPKNTHALDAVLTALEMMLAMQHSNAERSLNGQRAWDIRIGIHSGPIVAGVVGEKKFAYDIWGNTVNLASRMESNSLPGHINISGATYAQVMDLVEVRPRGPIKVRGKGELHMYFLVRLKPEFSADAKGLVPNERLLRIRQERLTLMVT